MSDARLGYGTKLLMGDATAPPNENFAELGEIVEGPDDEDSVELVEVTNHQSPNRRREYIGALIDGGEITITCNYIPDHPTHDRSTGVRAFLGQTRNFRIEEPGNPEGEQWPCVIMNVSRSRPVAGAMQMSVTLKKAGDVTYYNPTP